MGWSQEREDAVKALWADGLSASQIAAEIGGVTRNAVIGKVHRLGLSGRTKMGAPSTRPRKPPPIWVPKVKTGRALFNTAFAPIAVDPVVEAEQFEIPVEQRKTLLQLSNKHCHWPVGDPCTAGFFYCGGIAAEDQPYCSFHCRVAYQPTRDRRGATRPHHTRHRRSRRMTVAKRNSMSGGGGVECPRLRNS